MLGMSLGSRTMSTLLLLNLTSNDPLIIAIKLDCLDMKKEKHLEQKSSVIGFEQGRKNKYLRKSILS